MLVVMDKDRHLSNASVISSQRLRIGLFELRSLAILAETCFDEIGFDVFFNGSYECSLGVGAILIVENGDLLVHSISTL
jgi:hypothetical protein